jgi:hypothetical protein
MRGLPIPDVAADLLIEASEFGVDGERGAQPGRRECGL